MVHWPIPGLERDSSAVECRTRNQVSPGSNPPLLLFRRLGIFVDSGGHVSDLVFARNCSIARMLPGEAKLVSEWTGLPRRAKSVKRSERSNGLDTALYKYYLYILPYLFDNVVSYVINKTKDGGIYLMIDTKTGTKPTSSKESLAQHGGRMQAYTMNCQNHCIFHRKKWYWVEHTTMYSSLMSMWKLCLHRNNN